MADEKPVVTEEPQPEPTLVEQAGAIPETVVPAEPVEEPEPVVEATPEAPKAEELRPAPKQKPWFIM